MMERARLEINRPVRSWAIVLRGKDGGAKLRQQQWE